VRADETVGGRAAHEEARGEQPEVALASGADECAERVRQWVGSRQRDLRVVRARPVRQEAEVGRTIAHDEEDNGNDEEKRAGDDDRDRAPAAPADQ
jgi:hypothetical protein